MSSVRHANFNRAVVLSLLMMMMTQVGYLESMNAWTNDDETLDESTDVLETGGSGASNFTASVEGADLIIDEAMTNITFQYNDTEAYNGNGTAWMVKDIYSGSTGSSPAYLTAVGNTLYFRANNGIDFGAFHSVTPSNNPIFQTFIDCLVNGYNFGLSLTELSFSPKAMNAQDTTFPVPWTVSMSFEQVHPLEDPVRGDSDGSSENPPLLAPNSNTDGLFNTYGDVDRFAIPIQHGTMQHFEVYSQDYSEFKLLSGDGSDCILGEDNTTFNSNSYAFELETDWIRNSFSCDTRYFDDEIQFQISQSTWPTPQALAPYQIHLFTSELVNISSPLGDQVGIDAPARGMVPVLNLDDTINGTFLHWSDQTDRYELRLGLDEIAQVELLSNCASFNPLSKQSALETLPIIQSSFIDVHRLQSNDIHDPELKDTCTYSLRVSEYTLSPTSMPYAFSYDGRFHPSYPIQIQNLSESLPPYIVATEISMSVPFDLLPTIDGIIHATQSSGSPVTLQLFGTHSRDSEINNMSVGQHIDFGSSRVQWDQLSLSGLDGSELAVYFTQQNLMTYTKEGSELFSIGNGALGSSIDEGWDGEDVLTVNNSGSMATFASVRISAFSENFKAAFSGSSISKLICFNSNTANVQIHHQQGDGMYTLQVERGYTACPSVSLYAPNEVAESSQFTVHYTDWNDDALELMVKIYDENLNSIYQTSDTNPTQAIELPSFITEGTYHLLLVDENNIVYDERQLEVLRHPSQSVQPTKIVLDVNEAPQIQIESFMPHSGEPVAWTFTNISLTTLSKTGIITSQVLDEEFTGLGAKVVTIMDIPEVMPGSTLSVQGELYTGESYTHYSLIWKKVFLEPSIICETELIPDAVLPENDVLCLVSLYGKVHGGSSNGLTEYQVEGTLDIYDEQFELVEQVEFRNNLFRSTPIRIDSVKLGTGFFFAKMNVSTAINVFLTEEVTEFEIGSFTSSEESQQILGIYDLKIISVRDTALAGDNIVITWETTGEDTAYFLIDVYGDGDLIQSLSILNDGSKNGNFKVILPEDINPYITHLIAVHAFSEYGSVDSKTVSIEGMNYNTYLDVNINPDRPKLGSNFDVELLLSSDDSWLSWNWALHKTSSSSSDVLSQGNGFVSDNNAKFKILLPLSQYTSSPYLHLEVESEDGTLYYEIIEIEPLPLRSVKLDMDSEMIIDTMYNVEWQLDGQYLNTLDNIERIQFSIYTMDSELYLENVYYVNSTKGAFETHVPVSLIPGSHFVVVEFTFADGDTYETSQIITLLSSPLGLNAFGLNIPPLAMGFDTVLVVLLVCHAVFLHRRSSRKKKGGDTAAFEDAEYDDDDDDDDDDYTGEFPYVPKKVQSAIIDSTKVADEYPMHQEYPVGSGNYWIQYASDLEWEKVEI